MNIETKNLWKKNASEILALIDQKEISIEEVLESSLNRIKEINPDINAVVTLINEVEKKKLINNFKNSTDSILKGMPVLIKDMNDVKDMRTTYGSKLYADHIPKKSDIVVQTITAGYLQSLQVRLYPAATILRRHARWTRKI